MWMCNVINNLSCYKIMAFEFMLSFLCVMKSIKVINAKSCDLRSSHAQSVWFITVYLSSRFTWYKYYFIYFSQLYSLNSTHFFHMALPLERKMSVSSGKQTLITKQNTKIWFYANGWKMLFNVCVCVTWFPFVKYFALKLENSQSFVHPFHTLQIHTSIHCRVHLCAEHFYQVFAFITSVYLCLPIECIASIVHRAVTIE